MSKASSSLPELGWREGILGSFTPEMAISFPLTVVHDSDGLLADPLLQSQLERCGFETRVYDDPFKVRLEYEVHVRGAAEAGVRLPGFVILHHGSNLKELPFDMLARAQASHRTFVFTVGDMFPSMAPASLTDLGPVRLDRLYRAIEMAPVPEPMGLGASRDLLLSELFGLDVERLRGPSDLLSALCQLHLKRHELPASLADHLIERLRELGQDADWPLDSLVSSRDHFLSFLQEHWTSFVDRLSASSAPKGVKEKGASYGSAEGSPIQVPFDEPTVRGWVASLFIEGQLEPVEWSSTVETTPEPYRWGLIEPQAPALDERVTELAGHLTAAIPADGASYQDWLDFAPRWGELGALRYGDHLLEGSTTELVEALWIQVDTAFRSWMEASFGSLELVPKPIMLHKVLRHLQKRRTSGRFDRVALLVMDGMAWSQWITLRDLIKQMVEDCLVSERSVFAWVPSVTPVSRQALFAGSAPREFPESIGTTAKDEGHWTRFWMDGGVGSAAVKFVPPRHSESNEAALARLRESVEHPICKVLAMVVPTVDEIAHGAVGGTAGLQAQVVHWARTGWLTQGIELLLKAGFEVWLTSDHGNLECVGTGRPNEGVLVDQRGARARVFSDKTARKMIAADYPNSIFWPAPGLPEGYFPLLSSAQTAFATNDQIVVSHGGISLEEVIVPLVRINRADS